MWGSPFLENSIDNLGIWNGFPGAGRLKALRGGVSMEEWQEKFWQAIQVLRGKMEESWRLRAAGIFVLAVCAALALFVCSGADEKQETTGDRSGAVLISEGGSGKPPVKEPEGIREALLQKPVGNPFLPGHPLAAPQGGSAKTVKAKQEGHAVVSRDRKTVQEDTAEGKSTAKRLQLQGIINEGEYTGALVAADGRVRFLTAGEEAWQGCSVASVRQDGASIDISGTVYELQVGDTIPAVGQQKNYR